MCFPRREYLRSTGIWLKLIRGDYPPVYQEISDLAMLLRVCGLVVVACSYLKRLLDAEAVLVHESHLPAGLCASFGFGHAVEPEGCRKIPRLSEEGANGIPSGNRVLLMPSHIEDFCSNTNAPRGDPSTGLSFRRRLFRKRRLS